MDEDLIERLVAKARFMYADGHQIDVDSFEGELSECDDGAWVRAWVFVPYEEIDDA